MHFLYALAEVLVKTAKARRTITYGELCKKLNHTVDPGDINHLLDVISEQCSDLVMPLLSAIVVNEDTGMPEDGFFTLYRELKGLQPGKEFDAWELECKKVWEFDQWELLLAKIQ